ncbi:hypothetical protein RB2083_3958 [Rhodobacteraceae bacterium HTCC2083]|nr:hypothetical protein RB2083_850 [Rhodobacteraceae bacterium HTCC2083]EDZ41845.1 hypothetical protein RB2083_1360 [Rhodobacteraceae bacterium HTCC2083]EDZ42266.1 hypothetical protein RB2083_1781 [Rhodobacteraceae bacterium HTCC2083]EDZ42650.1 hypothetical protein RB2083_2165 [Rhodobacteraceae bacterium HTCC2083]EDZ43535.1 hypothetical protein RB2083_3050 [Rhodobacteraceae bacterium HTCC2083]
MLYIDGQILGRSHISRGGSRALLFLGSIWLLMGNRCNQI